MSELDFEDDIASESAVPTANVNKMFGKKFPINSEETIASKTNIAGITVSDKNNEYHNDKPDDQLVDQNSEEGEVESDTGELSESGQDLNDLEEGEINDSNTDNHNTVLCRFFQKGCCRFGLQCRFVHIGASAYKMFDNQSTKSLSFGVANPAVLYQPLKLNPVVSYPTTNTGDAWEQGLHEAKKLVLIARDKKETDIEFEEKKLYLGVQKEKLERDRRDSFVRKSNLEDRKEKHSKSIEADSQSNLPKYVRRETNKRKQSNYLSKSKSYSESWTDPWRRSRSRTRSRSRSPSSLSSVSSERRSCAGSCSSACSACSSPGEGYSLSKKRAPEPESKLKRVFSRIFSRSRSRERSSSYSRSRTRSCSPKRPLFRSVTRKRSAHRSYSRSRSSSASRYSKKYRKKDLPPRSPSKSEFLVSSASGSAQTHEQLKRNRKPSSSPLQQWPKRTSNSGSESCCSDMTVSSITCTSLTDSCSSVDRNSVKSGKNPFSSVAVSSIRNDQTSLQSDADFLKTYHINQFDNNNTNKRRTVQKTISPVKQLKLDVNCLPEISKKTINENLKFERKSTDLNKQSSDQTRLRKPFTKKTAAELELLKYVPAKNRGFTFAQTRTNVSTKLGTRTPATKKIININLKSKSEVLPSKSEISNVVSKTPSKTANKTLSRREQLLLQLQAVELAIAKRKTMTPPKQ